MAYLEKWLDFSTHNDWSERTVFLSRYIPESTKTILELGSGRNHLRALNLLDLTKIDYRSSDITKGEGIDEVIDLNASDLPQTRAELIFFSGLVEYVFDVPRFFAWTRSTSDVLLGTYSPVLTSPLSFEDSIRRSNNGWKNHLSLSEFHAIALSSGWAIEFKERYMDHILFVGHRV